MNSRSTFALAGSMFLTLLFAGAARAEKIHLFILSGQSNMAGLNPNVSFTPTVKKALADDEVIVAKSAAGGQPIRRWYKKWKPEGGDKPQGDGALYGRLMSVVNKKLGAKKPDTITFVWMQGERDAKERHGNVYQASMDGLLDQLRSDLKHEKINFVIGRLSDHLAGNNNVPHWDIVRQAQVAAAEAIPRGAWVDTDDLNGPNNGLHYTKEGYAELGRRFAEKSLELIRKSAK